MFKPDKPYNSMPLLPPDRKKIETITILKQESNARAALAELKGVARTLPNPSILINGIVLKEAKASSEIENVITTHDKLYKALTLKNEKIDGATKEVLRYREALFLGFDFIKKKGFLNTNGIIDIQKVLEKNDAGIRKNPGTVLKNDLTDEVIYTPPDDKDAINKLMKNLEEFINVNDDNLSPLIKMAIQHYQFESIHPFYDGNGRTGRIINVLYLQLTELLEIPILYLSGYITKNKNDYYKLLREVTVKGNWEAWILYMLKGVESTANDTIKQINQINKLFDTTVEKVKKEMPKIYSKELIELLYVNPYTKTEHIVSGLMVDRKTATKYLKSLESIGVIKSEQKWKEVIYINTKLYDLFKK